MVGNKDRKESSKKGKSTIRGGIVNQLEENPDELSDSEEIQEGDQEKSKEMEKNPAQS